MPIDIEKLALLRTISNALAERELMDVNLLLHEAGITEVSWGAWYDERYDITTADRANTVLERIRDLTRSGVEELAAAVKGLFEVSIEVHDAEEAQPLKLFASHLAKHKAVVGSVGDQLSGWGIELFVAHDSIEPDQEWQIEIERALRTSHAGIVFLFPGFEKSAWCDQEVGWLLGREVPCYPLKFEGQDPYGPLGKKQAYTVPDGTTALEIGAEILRWVESKPALRSSLNASLVDALKHSWNFNRTDRVWERLRNAREMGARQVSGLLTSIRDNDQVYNAHHSGPDESGPYSELIFKLAMDQPGFAANRELASEVAKSRGLESLLLSTSPTPMDPWNTAAGEPF